MGAFNGKNLYLRSIKSNCTYEAQSLRKQISYCLFKAPVLLIIAWIKHSSPHHLLHLCMCQREINNANRIPVWSKISSLTAKQPKHVHPGEKKLDSVCWREAAVFTLWVKGTSRLHLHKDLVYYSSRSYRTSIFFPWHGSHRACGFTEKMWRF